jgi:hypothetical protein
MNIKKPVARTSPLDSKLCPVCGTFSYSRDRIHPQCAMRQADRPQQLRLRAEKKKQATPKLQPKRSWTKKCPKCDTDVHVRLQVCACGHNFGGR